MTSVFFLETNRASWTLKISDKRRMNYSMLSITLFHDFQCLWRKRIARWLVNLFEVHLTQILNLQNYSLFWTLQSYTMSFLLDYGIVNMSSISEWLCNACCRTYLKNACCWGPDINWDMKTGLELHVTKCDTVIHTRKYIIWSSVSWQWLLKPLESPEWWLLHAYDDWWLGVLGCPWNGGCLPGGTEYLG